MCIQYVIKQNVKVSYSKLYRNLIASNCAQNLLKKKPLTSRQENQNCKNANLCPGFTTLLVLREQGEALKGS